MALNRLVRGDSTLVLTHPRHTVRFSTRGIAFTPREGPRWSYELISATVDGERIDEPAAEPAIASLDGLDMVAYRHGSIIERYVARAGAVEQQFLIPERLARNGDLLITGAVKSDGNFQAVVNGWTWTDDRGTVRLGDVTVVDAAGKTVPATMEVTATSTVIRVAGEGLSSAIYPVTVDPLIGGIFRISDMGPSDSTLFGSLNSAVAYNSTDNEYLVVWAGDDDSGELVNNEFEIFGQRIAAATGQELGTNDFRISDMGTDGYGGTSAHAPAVAYNSLRNEYLVVWEGDDDTAPLVDNELEIFGQRLDAASGNEIGSNDFRISSMGPNGDADYAAGDPAVVYNPTHDEYLVVWQGDDDTLPLVDDEAEIFAQRLDGATGALEGGRLRISDMGDDGDPSTPAESPTVAYNGVDDQYLVVWSGRDQFPVAMGGFAIFMQRLDGASAAELGTNDQRLSGVGGDFVPPPDTSRWDNKLPDVAYSAATHEYLVVWRGGVTFHNTCGLLCSTKFYRVYGQRITGLTGAEVGADDFEVDGLIRGVYLAVAVTVNDGGDEYLVVWQEADSRVRDIVGQRLRAAGGERVGASAFRVAQTLSTPPGVAVAGAANGDYLAVGTWALSAGKHEVWGQRLSAKVGAYVLDGYGGIHAAGGSPPFTEAVSFPPNFDVARDLELARGGYYLLDGFGGVHAGDDAPAIVGPAPPYFGFDIARDLELADAGCYVLDGFGGVHIGGDPTIDRLPATPYFGFDAAEDFEVARYVWGGALNGENHASYYVLDAWGGVHAGGDAALIVPTAPYFGFDIARDLELSGTGYYVLDGFGGIHAGGDVASIPPGIPYFGFDVAEDLELAATGHYVLDAWGGVHRGGGAPPLTLPPPYFGWDIARDIELQ